MITLSLTSSTHLNSLLHLTPPPLTPACAYPNKHPLSHPPPLTHILSHAHHHPLTFLIHSLPLYSSSKSIIISHSPTHNRPLPLHSFHHIHTHAQPLETVDFNEPISPSLERRVLTTMISICESYLEQYPTRVEDDEALMMNRQQYGEYVPKRQSVYYDS